MKLKIVRGIAAAFRWQLVTILAALLVAQPACAGRIPAEKELPDAPAPASEPQTLTITILEGEGALNNIRARTARDPIVQVTDENHKPVAGASVLFRIYPGTNGAGGSFSGEATLKVQTDAAGRAVGHGILNNARPGEFQIRVTATRGKLIAQETIRQVNSKPISSTAGHLAHLTHFAGTTNGIVTAGVVGTAIVTGIVVGIVTHGAGSNHVTLGGGGVGVP